jgi:outer membrane protein assembly factor BamB
LGIESHDRATGALKWDVATGRGFGAAYADNQTAYIADQGIKAYDASTGEALWSVGEGTVRGSAFQSPNLYFNDDDITIKALDTLSRKILWRTGLSSHDVSEIVSTLDTVVVVAYIKIYTLDAQTGKVVWSKDIRSNNAVRIEDVIYLADSFDQKVVALQASTGEELGQIQFGLFNLLGSPSDIIDAHNNALIVAFGKKVYGFARP